MKDIRIDLRYGPDFFFPFALKEKVARVVADALFSNKAARTEGALRIWWGVVGSCDNGLVIDIVTTEEAVKASNWVRDRLEKAKSRLAGYKVVREAGAHASDIRITLINAAISV